MAKAKKARSKAATTRAQAAPKRRGKAARLAQLAATMDAATALASGQNGHAVKLVAVPRRGAGRRKMVDARSLDGIAAQLANELAADIVGKVRSIADRMVRTTLADMLAKM